LIIISTICFSQTNSLVGKWKVVSAFDGDIYISSKPDSFYISDRFKKLFEDSISMANKFFQTFYLGNQFEFKKNGTYNIYPKESPIVAGEYTVSRKDSIIFLNKREDSSHLNAYEPKYFLGEANKLKYFYFSHLLHLYLEFDERHVEFTLQKMEK
jgi:hypothetical protein